MAPMTLDQKNKTMETGTVLNNRLTVCSDFPTCVKLGI
jgi:hypothetical protein